MVTEEIGAVETGLRGLYRSLRDADWLPRLLARLVLGIMFLLSGWTKLHGLPGLSEWFAKLGIPFPHLNAVFISVLELIGGACLSVGLAARFFAVMLTGDMAVALLTVGLQSKATFSEWLWKPEVLAIVIFLWLIFVGPGKASIDYLLARKWGLNDSTT